MAYDHRSIEKKAQEKWAELDLYRTTEGADKEKKYVLDMFPYPSGEGLHVGHPRGYIATDIYSRHMRMRGFSVLHPMGWDAFGLPAENYALKNKVHPRIAVEKNIANFKQQLAHIGFDYDWSHEINTTDPKYYHWTQWIFLKMFEHKLAFQSNEPINWCPSCMTGLANEDLDGPVCERCGTTVEKKSLPQWVLKITDYADRMLADLDSLQWPEHIKEAQRNWIGRSEGAEIQFEVRTSDVQNARGTSDVQYVTVFTTRPDTLYGAAYLVLAPEHSLVTKLEIQNADEVRAYVAAAAQKTEIERGAEEKEKTGVKLEGISAINPATKEDIPIYVADYVLGGYGTGAIMAVPAHDERDFEFAKKFELPIRTVIEAVTGQPQENPEHRKSIVAIVVDRKNDTVLTLDWGPELGGKLYIGGGREEDEDAIETAKREIAEETGYTDVTFVAETSVIHHSYFAYSKNVAREIDAIGLLFILNSDARNEQKLEKDEHGKFSVSWMPLAQAGREVTETLHKMVFDLLVCGHVYTGVGVLVESGEFTGKSSEEAKWEITKAVGGKRVTRYKLRDWVFSRQRYWGEPIPIIHCPTDGIVAVPYEDLPVLLPEVESYEPTGTGESPLAAIDSWVNTKCPKCGGPAKRETNTMPQWAGSSWYYLRFMDPNDDTQLVSTKMEKYWAPVDVYVGGDHAVRHLIYARFWHKFLYDIGVVSTKEPFARLEFLGFILAEDGRKMSKRYNNVINPDEVIAKYGADAFRVYEMFMGPFENTTSWNTASIAGTARFIERLWRMQEKVAIESVPALDTLLHETIRKIGNDIEAFKFNTAVSQMMIFLNAVEKEGAIGREQWSSYLRVLAPFAPHVTEALWEQLGEANSIHLASWPSYDESLFSVGEQEIIVQVAGRKRGSIRLLSEAGEAEAVEKALQLPKVITALEGREPKRVIYVPGKILNLVV
ncbi:MAG: class I tRNA ligase family protein [Patescibacteria group bacterium]|nr:class I tRNA ligase family protein [Patescibacteria group bacterium]